MGPGAPAIIFTTLYIDVLFLGRASLLLSLFIDLVLFFQSITHYSILNGASFIGIFCSIVPSFILEFIFCVNAV
jgi:hypothetical protein